MIRINDILDKIYDYYPDADMDIIDRAYIFSARVHAGQMRLNGEPYLSHPLEVAGILADLQLDPISIAAGLLHDVVEDTHAGIGQILDMFGPEVAHIVAGVTKISKMPVDTTRSRQAESIRKMILAMADDLRVILVKLADRLHNMRTLQFHRTEEKKRSIAQETLDIYAAIASRLGIYWIKQELEEISFFYTMPEEYERIKNFVKRDQAYREEFVETVKNLLSLKMEEANLKADILGRYKQLYSIFHKMQSQNLEFEEVYDITAFRIILDTVPQCYEALGHIHALWRPIPNKFKDYIGNPKPNNYQSLHTTVIGPSNERIEVQIRTHDMDNVAKYGIAAHWSYKEGKSKDETKKESFAWLQNLLENQEEFGDPDDFLENVRIDLYPDEVYVNTPQGDVKSLPKEATPVDFAYLVHTEVGNQCTGAKVNGRLVPLQYKLQTGDIVEIITSRGHHPSKDWLNFVKTVKARSRIRQWVKKEEKERSLSLGREMCEKAFRKVKMSFNNLVNTPEMEKAAAEFKFKSIDDLIASVGFGKITPRQIINKLKPEKKQKKDESLLEKLLSRAKESKKRDSEGVVVQGLDDILIKFGQCCKPVPGDAITGYITHGSGVTIHRQGCVNALKMNPDRRIEVTWKDNKGVFPVKMKLRAYDKVGLLAEISSLMGKHDTNIIDVHLESQINNEVIGFFTIGIKDTDHLSTLFAQLKKIDAVHEVKRV